MVLTQSETAAVPAEHQGETVDSRADDTQRLREQYIAETALLARQTVDGVTGKERWKTMKGVATTRAKLVSALHARQGRVLQVTLEDLESSVGSKVADVSKRNAFKLYRAILGVEGASVHDLEELHAGEINPYRARSIALLRGILAHFRSEDLHVQELEQYNAFDDEDGAQFDTILSSILRKLSDHSSWQNSDARIQKYNGTLQEDVLMQEAWMLASALNGEEQLMRAVLQKIQFLRARDSANILLQESLFGSHVYSAVNGSDRKHVLSVGAGNAQLIDGITRRYVNTHGTAVDFGDPRPEDERDNDRLQFIEQDALKYLEQEGSTKHDLIILKDVLHETRDPRVCLQRAIERLQEHGTILLVEPTYSEGDTASHEAQSELDSTSYPHHLQSHQQLSALLEECDLEVVSRNHLEPGVADNNDSFHRIALVLKKRSKRAQ